MTIYTIQLLNLSPFTRIFLLKDEQSRNATFAVRDRKEIATKKYNIITEQVILDYMRNMLQADYSQEIVLLKLENDLSTI